MKSFIAPLFLLLGLTTFSQLSISTNYRQDAVWDNTQEKWNVLSVDESGTLFEFNDALTTLRHITPTISSSYFIQKWEYNEDKSAYTMDVTSDVGNQYELIVDGINECVAFFYWKEKNYYMVRHSIKSSWIRE